MVLLLQLQSCKKELVTIETKVSMNFINESVILC